MMNDHESREGSRSSWIRQLFEIDVRSLASLRVGMACVILFDLIFLRWPFVDVFFTDQGMLSREMAEQFLGVGYWSLYSFDGASWSVEVLFWINLVAAVGLLVGLRTRTMTITCLVLVWSIQTRNPLVLSGGDVLLRVLLFWSVFLPLGAVWSVDARFRRPARRTELSMATISIMMQMAMMYFFAGLCKCNEFWFRGEAIEYAMHLEMYTKPFAGWLLAAPGLLKVATIGVLILELLAPWLLFVPWQNRRLRMGLLIAFWLMHVGIWMTMSIGIFAAISMIGWFVFLPGSFWDRLCGRPDGYASEHPVDYPVIRKLANVVCAIALVFCFAINVANFQKTEPAWYQSWGALFAKTTMLLQEFELWGEPPTVSPTFEYPAVVDGRSVDLLAWYLSDQETKPDSEYLYFSTQAWRRVHWELRNDGELRSSIRKRLLDWLVARWNASHEHPIESAQIIYRERPIHLAGDRTQEPDAAEPQQVTASVWAVWP